MVDDAGDVVDGAEFSEGDGVFVGIAKFVYAEGEVDGEFGGVDVADVVLDEGVGGLAEEGHIRIARRGRRGAFVR